MAVESKNSANLQVPNSVRLTEASICRSQPIGKLSLTPDGARTRYQRDHEFHPQALATLLADSLRLDQPPPAGNHRVPERSDQALLDEMGRKRILLTDDQRRVLAVKGKALGLDNQIIDPGGEVGRGTGEVQCRERLGGMLRYYYCDAA